MAGWRGGRCSWLATSPTRWHTCHGRVLAPPCPHAPPPPSPRPAHAHARLKKLNRMMTSSVAQQAADRFRRHTLLLTGLIAVVHVVCFVVLITQIDARFE
jgi:hypothetical protein